MFSQPYIFHHWNFLKSMSLVLFLPAFSLHLHILSMHKSDIVNGINPYSIDVDCETVKLIAFHSIIMLQTLKIWELLTMKRVRKLFHSKLADNWFLLRTNSSIFEQCFTQHIDTIRLLEEVVRYASESHCLISRILITLFLFQVFVFGPNYVENTWTTILQWKIGIDGLSIEEYRKNY